jgi:hypothetical protein
VYKKFGGKTQMFNLNFLKKSNSEAQPNRCHFQHQNGRRCRLPVADETTPFCGTHRDMLAEAKTREEREAESAAILAEVYGPVKNLDSAVAINHVLSNLFRLTLEGRIPQRKAALLTSMCRTLLRSVEAAHREASNANLFPGNNTDLLNLLAAIQGENAEPEDDVVAASLDSPGVRQPQSLEKRTEHVTITRSNSEPPAAADRDADSTSLAVPKPGEASLAATHAGRNLEGTQSNEGNVVWIGHNLFHPERSSTAFFRQVPEARHDAPPAPQGNGAGKAAEIDFNQSA